MLRKLATFILLTAAATAAISAQQEAPAARGEAEKQFNFSFGGSGSYLGVRTREVTKENYAGYGLREVRGAAVEKVVENSPAARAGLQAGDVIVKFNGEEVRSVRQLTRLINEVAPDHQANLTILRGGGGEREITATLGKRETPEFTMGNFDFGSLPPMKDLPLYQRAPLPNRGLEPFGFAWQTGERRQIGAATAPLTKQLGEYFGVADGKGILVSDVRENSPAARAGLKAGDVITEIDGTAVKQNSELIRAINEKKEGDVNLTIIRNRERQSVRVSPETVKGGPTPFQGFENFDEDAMPPMNFKLAVPPAPPTPPEPPTPQSAPLPKEILLTPGVL